MNPAHHIQQDYETLGLSYGASLDQVKAAYRGLARELHPDLHPGALGVMMTRVNQAYQRILDHHRKTRQKGSVQEYVFKVFKDAMHRFNGRPQPESPRASFNQAPRPEPRPEAQARPVADLPVHASSPERTSARPSSPIISEKVAAKAAPAAPHVSKSRIRGVEKRGEDLVYFAEIKGRPEHLTLPIRGKRTCPDCNGGGVDYNRGNPRFCPSCGGRGYIVSATAIKVDLPEDWAYGAAFKIPGRQASPNGGDIVVQAVRPGA